MRTSRGSHLCLAYLIGTRALAKVGAGVSGDDSGRSLQRRCTRSRSRRFPSKCRQMRLVYPGVRRRHCRNYPLRPPGPSERCLASAPYLESAELSPPLSPLSHSVTLSYPLACLSSPAVFVEHVHTHVSFALPLAGPPKTQPTNPTNHPPTHFA